MSEPYTLCKTYLEIEYDGTHETRVRILANPPVPEGFEYLCMGSEYYWEERVNKLAMWGFKYTLTFVKRKGNGK